jgi:hypothetical protein
MKWDIGMVANVATGIYFWRQLVLDVYIGDEYFSHFHHLRFNILLPQIWRQYPVIFKFGKNLKSMSLSEISWEECGGLLIWIAIQNYFSVVSRQIRKFQKFPRVQILSEE